LRHKVITGLVALAAALGTCAAIPAARAALSSSTTAASSTTTAATVAGPGDLAKLQAPWHALPALRPALAVAPAATTAAWDFFTGVSCKHAGDCLAVGGNNNGGGGHGSPLASLWDGTAWRASTVHLPSGSTAGYLYGVSCKTDGCVAVGYYRKNNHNYPLAQYWNGNSWSLGAHQPALPSGGAADYLQSISCVTANSCVAVGAYTPSSNSNNLAAFAEYWNGSSWKVSKPPTPSTPFSFLDTVYCAKTTYCLAGGSYVASTGAPLLAELWTGSGWHQTTVTQPTPQSGWFNEIDGVSCSASVTNCTLVGDIDQLHSDNTITMSTFAEVHSASGWSLTSVPMPSGQQSFLNSVSCTSATSCIASGGVGPYTNSYTQGHAAVAAWNGVNWSVKVLTPPAGQGSVLWTDECVSPTYCVAVGTVGTFGTRTGHALTAIWNGTTWTTRNTL